MNAVEIEEAVSLLAEQPFEADAFPYAFLEAFGNKATTIKRLKSSATNKSDVGGVLQRGNIHIKTCGEGEVAAALNALRENPATEKQKARFILATDGSEFQAEDLDGGDTIACDFRDFSNHFVFFLKLGGISFEKQIKDVELDIKATSRLNRLYVELLKDNPEWGTEARRHEMNHFMARLIFCFFAEDTDIFNGSGLFTATVEQMSDRDSSNTHEIIAEIFRAMDTKIEDRAAGNFRPWANQFPLVNGGLFSGSLEAPKFSKIARSYLLHVGNLDWTKINPDIFGSMIQAVADDEERGALGMHYTSVPNILKVLNPLFLDDLRAKLDEAGDNGRKLLNLRNRIARIRVFDPACGSGNFLVIAYKEMRAIEAEINLRRGERERRTDIPLTNFRGIELRDFLAEIARLALIIAEYQCDVMYRGQKEALAEFLPLEKANWITCDNPPYLGSTWQSKEQKSELKSIFEGRTKSWKSLDYVAGWFMRAADYGIHTEAAAAFVSTNSICQGQQVPILWPLVFETGNHIHFAHTSFKWANLASHNAGVTVAIIGICRNPPSIRSLYALDETKTTFCRKAEQINAYLVAAPSVIVKKASKPIYGQAQMSFGNKPVDGGHLLLSAEEVEDLGLTAEQQQRFIRRIYGSVEFIRGIERYVLWIEDKHLKEAESILTIRERIEGVRTMRLSSRDKSANEMAKRAHQMREMNIGIKITLVAPRTSSESRHYLPCGIIDNASTVTSEAFALYDAQLWNMALIASRLHLMWIATVCGKLKTDFRYSNTLGWNTFPLPKLTESNKADLTRCAEDILVAREAHFPATIAELYNPKEMPDNLREAHDRNDEVLERIYIGRRFKNDTERLEKLFELYIKMTAGKEAGKV